MRGKGDTWSHNNRQARVTFDAMAAYSYESVAVLRVQKKTQKKITIVEPASISKPNFPCLLDSFAF